MMDEFGGLLPQFDADTVLRTQALGFAMSIYSDQAVGHEQVLVAADAIYGFLISPPTMVGGSEFAPSFTPYADPLPGDENAPEDSSEGLQGDAEVDEAGEQVGDDEG